MGLGGVATAALPSVVRLQMVFSDRLGGVQLSPLGFAACQSKNCTNRAIGTAAWLVHHRGCSCPNCTNRAIGTTAWLVHLRQVHPLKAPPEIT